MRATVVIGLALGLCLGVALAVSLGYPPVLIEIALGVSFIVVGAVLGGASVKRPAPMPHKTPKTLDRDHAD